MKSLAERFEEKYRVEDSGCWVWTASYGSVGYGQIGRGRKGEGLLGAHRASFEIHRGPIPAGLWVLHRCDNRACVNPAHLFLGTQADNMADAAAKGRTALGERNGVSKLSPDDVRKIRIFARVLYQRVIAKKYGVSQTTVSKIVRRVRWGHIA